MMGKEKPTFYLYGQGEPEDVICLGNLVLKDPRNPRVPGYFWTADVLNDADRKTWTYTTQIEGEFTTKGGAKLGIAVEAADLVNIDLSWAQDRDRIVTATDGQRVLLRDPQKFLNERILPHPKAQEQLRLWLTTSNSLKRLLRAKIWMCTGVYILEDASMHEVRSTETTVQPGISSATMAAITGTPVGGSITIAPNKRLENTLTARGRLVWAAQYRLLDIKYVGSSAAQWGPGGVATPTMVRLLPDVVSNATLRGGDAEYVHVTVDEEPEGEDDTGEDVVRAGSDLDTGDEGAWSQFDQTLEALTEYYEE